MSMKFLSAYQLLSSNGFKITPKENTDKKNQTPISYKDSSSSMNDKNLRT